MWRAPGHLLDRRGERQWAKHLSLQCGLLIGRTFNVLIVLCGMLQAASSKEETKGDGQNTFLPIAQTISSSNHNFI
jgi:hypothetical protein